MNFTHYDLGSVEKGRYVRVTLEGNAANVLLLDDANYHSYVDGKPHQYIGGLAQRSPVHFQIPNADHWHISVNLEGLGGSVRAGVTLLYPKAGMTVSNLMTQSTYNMGPGGQTAPVRDTPPAYPPPSARTYDLFICYVTADKNEVARPLAQFLAQRGIRAGVEEFELKANAPIWPVLDRTLDCRYGIFIISKNFIQHGWPQDELSALVMKFLGNKPTIFPIWHKVSDWEVHLFSREIAKKPARWTGLRSLESLADDIAANIRH